MVRYMSIFTQRRIPTEKFVGKVEILQCSKLADNTFSYF
jgi:hypothetical protein